MGQYWWPVNLDKKEYINPHVLGTGLKLWEQLANHPGTGSALIVLCAAMPEARGGGDFDLFEDWHGSEWDPAESQPVPTKKEYHEIAEKTIGRWAGDRIALIGDYAEDDDLPGFNAKEIFEKMGNEYVDISQNVAIIIEHELNGRYRGDGWREFSYKKQTVYRME